LDLKERREELGIDLKCLLVQIKQVRMSRTEKPRLYSRYKEKGSEKVQKEMGEMAFSF